MRYIFISIVVILLNTSSVVEAASFNSVSISTVPEYPKPGEATSISLQSYSYELQGLPISWYLNGVFFKEGIGLTKISLSAPGLGSATSVKAQIGNITNTTLEIRPTTVDILWEADTSTPKYFLGRALPVDSSNIHAVAIPHLGNQDATNLIYKWYINGRFLKNLSGANRNTIVTSSPKLYDDYFLSLDILDNSGRTLGSNGVKIHSTEPEVILYNISPLLGVITYNALGAATIQESSIERTVLAVPYYFNTPSIGNLSYKWDIFNAEYIQDIGVDSITITDAQVGAGVSVEITNPEALLQSSHTAYRFKNYESLHNDTYGNGDYQSPFGSSE